MRKGHGGAEMKKKQGEKKKIKTFLVATNVVASRLPERQPTGTPTARAKRIEEAEAEVVPNSSSVKFKF